MNKKEEQRVNAVPIAYAKVRLGVVGFALALSITSCGSGAGMVVGPTVTAAAASGPESLPVGNGSATLDWTPVTQNTDGSVLADLAGYKLYYGTSPDGLDTIIVLPNPSLTAYIVTSLPSGTWYFGVTAYTGNGAESALSNVGQKAIQ